MSVSTRHSLAGVKTSVFDAGLGFGDAFDPGWPAAPDSDCACGVAHAEQAMAREVGMPGGYDVGPQRISWMGQLMSNWTGDDGFLRRLNVAVRRPNIFGDVSWCRAKVVDKRLEEGAHLVDLEAWVENQLGEATAQGTAVVELPARGKAAPARRF